MASLYDVHIKSARPLATPPNDEGDTRQRSLRLGTHLIAAHHCLIEHLPALAELAAQQGSSDIVSLSPLLKKHKCLTPEGIRLVLDFVCGKEAFVKPQMVADLLAAANALRVDDLIAQVEEELSRLALYDDSILFSLEHATLNMDEKSPVRHHIIQAAALRLDKISNLRNFVTIRWPTFEVLMKNAVDAPAAVFMNAFIKWVHANRCDQTRSCSLLISSRINELNVEEKEKFAQQSASLYLHGVSSAMSKLSGSIPFIEERVITHRWTTCSDLSISSSVDVIAIHEEPFTNTNISVDFSQLSEEGRLYSDIEDSIAESLLDGEDNKSFFDDRVQEEWGRMGAGAEGAESSDSLSTATSSGSFLLETKMIDFGTIPIPDGEIKQIQLSIELDDNEQALDYIRKMRFHFDMEVDQNN